MPSTQHEVLLLALLGWLSYSAATVLDLSPILSVFFAGIAMSHYTWHSLSASSKVNH